jgi:hypothetical protein
MKCKKHSDWFRIKPMGHGESVCQESRVRLDITICPKFDNSDMRLTITIMLSSVQHILISRVLG